MTIGSFQALSWRMEPSVSYSDWTLEITRTSSTTTVDRYHVHRSILAVGPRHSEYFAAQFQLTTKETVDKTSRIALEDARADAFPLLLDFLYNRQIPDLTAASAACLYHLSEYFDMPELRRVVEDHYRQNLTRSTLVEYISCAQDQHTERLVEIAVENSVEFLLEIDGSIARQIGPELLLRILQKNQRAGNRRYGFHTSKLVADCCTCHEKELDKETFHQLTDTEILPYMDAMAAVYFLSIDAKWVTSPAQVLTPLQKRCTQSLTEKWKYIRVRLATDASLSQALSKVPPHILIDILMKATSEMALKASDDDSEDKDTPHEPPPRILVQNAGIPEVNGVFSRDGLFQGVSMYTRPGHYRGEPCLFSMFQCLVGSKTKRWFISTIPINGRPGTTKDIDFFSTLVTDDCILIPPQTNWGKSSDGVDPPPKLLF